MVSSQRTTTSLSHKSEEWISKIQYRWFGPVVQGDRAWEVSKTASLVASVWDIDRVATEPPLSIMEYHRASGGRD